ncbi:MAG TPA: 6-bladed beta-propeller [Anaerolineae bacterium]|nr:6-bladed beta-propeller [Anaerolineae bacterium]
MPANIEDTAEAAKLFRCPACGASLEVVDAPSVKCKYCGNSVPAPAHLRPRRPEPPVVIQTTTVDLSSQYGEAMRTSQRAGCIVSILVLLIIVGVTAVVLFSTQNTITTALDQVGQVVNDLPIGATPEPAVSPTPAFAEAVLEFGGEGSGPGLFDDPRYIGVDADGNIYVADFDDGRVQKFDSTGKFEWLTTVEPDESGYNTIEGLAVDFKGKLYISRRGDILVLNTADGELSTIFPGQFADTWYTTLVIDANDTLYALHASAGQDDLLVLNAAGKLQARWENFVSSLNKDDPALSLDLAVDGTGNLYVSSSFGEQVYIFDAQGKFIDRFGQTGDQPGGMNSPGAIAVDGRKRVYVINFGGIDVYTAQGGYLNTINPDYGKGAIRDIAIDIQGNLYLIISSGSVVKYRPNPLG